MDWPVRRKFAGRHPSRVVDGRRHWRCDVLISCRRLVRDEHEPCAAPSHILRVVLDTCILKLATFPGENNASGLATATISLIGGFRHESGGSRTGCAFLAFRLSK